MSECPHCSDGTVEPVKHLEFEKAHRRGNPFRRMCVGGCGRHVCMTSRTMWETSDEQLVLPVDGDEPVPKAERGESTRYSCPYDDCDASFDDEVPECPGCNRDLNWT